MEEVVQRFPHLAQNIFEKLDNQTVSNCRQISRNCNALINDQKFYWIRITENCLRDPEKSFIKILMQNNIPTVRKIALAAREYVYEDTLNTLRKKYVDGAGKVPLKSLMLTSLHYLAISGEIEIFKSVFESTLLRNHDKELVIIDDLVIENRENILTKNPADFRGITPLHLAVEFDQLEVCKFIIKNIKENNSKDFIRGSTPFHYAAEMGHIEICQLMIENVKEENSKDNDGMTPLHLAAQNGHLEVTQLIMSNVNEKSPLNNQGMNPIHFAFMNGHLNVCELIIINVGAKNPKKPSGWSLLHDAAEKGHIEICQLIINSDPSIVKQKNPSDCFGITPLHLAAEKGYLSVVQLVIKNVAEKNPECKNGVTPFHLALQNDHVHVVEYFQFAFLGWI